MELQIICENTGEIFSKTIKDVTAEDFFNIDDVEFEDFMDTIEEKYNVTLDLSAQGETIGYIVYETDDDYVLTDILEELYNFIITFYES